MRLVYFFSFCLILGMFFSQVFDLSAHNSLIIFLTDICLSYIMMEVGLEFILNKKEWRKYGKDYLVAAFAAACPWILCFLYFYYMFSDNTWEELLLIARFAAPTSSGILFAMLAAAGLAATWVFRKVEILAILDDMDTVLLLIPLQFLLSGPKPSLFVIIFFSILLLFLAWRFLHQIRLPSSRVWLLLYSVILTTIIHLSYSQLDIELEILLPAFVVGCMLYNPHDARIDTEKKYSHEHTHIEAKEKPLMFLDRGIKIIFMLLVGMLLPKLELHSFNYWVIGWHVLMITIVSNLGKCAPLFFYKDESTFKERLAVCVGMFPRGEVGAGVLALAIAYGAHGEATTIAIFSLAVNLILVGVFIKIVAKLTPVTPPLT
jgi:Kef-type K+ transport system membrane component KefB